MTFFALGIKNVVAKRTLRPRGAGDRTRTGTLSPAVDFESTTSTNSITPAKATCIIHEFTLICKRKITIGIITGGLEENLAVLKILSLAS